MGFNSAFKGLNLFGTKEKNMNQKTKPARGGGGEALINKLKHLCGIKKFHTSFHQFSVLYDWFTDFPVC
jgi:hypothetical protein